MHLGVDRSCIVKSNAYLSGQKLNTFGLLGHFKISGDQWFINAVTLLDQCILLSSIDVGYIINFERERRACFP